VRKGDSEQPVLVLHELSSTSVAGAAEPMFAYLSLDPRRVPQNLRKACRDKMLVLASY